MEEGFNIRIVEQPDKAFWGTIGQGLRNFNTEQAGDDKIKELSVALYSPGGELVGGVIAETYWEWLYINVMWVQQGLRGKGYGEQLLKRTEEEAKKRGVRHAYLDTFSFQAPGFYEKNGYSVFGKLLDFPPGHERYFYQKDLH
jgi:GNAT superfamily N-acetyltransferase